MVDPGSPCADAHRRGLQRIADTLDAVPFVTMCNLTNLDAMPTRRRSGGFNRCAANWRGDGAMCLRINAMPRGTGRWDGRSDRSARAGFRLSA